MNKRTGVKSSTCPVEIFYTGTNVYVRSNIHEFTYKDPVFPSGTVMYEFDEEEYTIEEWNKLNIETLDEKILSLDNRMAELEKCCAELQERLNKISE